MSLNPVPSSEYQDAAYYDEQGEQQSLPAGLNFQSFDNLQSPIDRFQLEGNYFMLYEVA